MSCDGNGVIGLTGGLLLIRRLRVTGLSAGLEPWRPARAVHDPGKIIADLELINT